MEDDKSAISIWLTDLGLARYITAFEENDLDESLLAELDHELLKEIGVTSVGHRLKIIKSSQAAAHQPQPAEAAPAPRTTCSAV